jgi:hypothetical protein
VLALDLPRHRIQQIVGVAVDLGSTIKHKLSGMGRIRPLRAGRPNCAESYGSVFPALS